MAPDTLSGTPYGAVPWFRAAPGRPGASPRGPSVPAAGARPDGLGADSVDVECERDIVSAVCRVRETAGHVRAAGARGSKNDCYRTTGVTLEFGRYNGVVAFDGTTVTVQAGMKIGRLNAFLRERGAIVPTCGEWQGATVAGSIATGSHGGSARYGIHSTSVVSLRLVTANGTTLDIDRRHPQFSHAAVSMGALGVISTVTLACVDSFCLELETRVLPFERYVAGHDALNGSSEFFSAVWFPAARRVLTFAANRVPPRAPTSPRMERFSAKTFMLDAASRHFNINAVTDRRLARIFVDTGDRILCPIPDRSARVRALRSISRDWTAMEVAVPVARAPDALERLDRFLNEHRGSMLNAVGLRTSASDSISLSPCYGREAFWIDLFFAGGNPRFTGTLGATIEELQGRCHWGKHVGLSAQHLRSQYPRFDEFRRARAALDPDETFCCPFTRRIDL
jgi:L-gulono-1,4-lactone dehydrogenase